MMNDFEPGTKEYFAREREILNEESAFITLMETQWEAAPPPEAVEPTPPPEPVELNRLVVGTTVLRLMDDNGTQRIEYKSRGEFLPMDSWTERELSKAYPIARNFIEAKK